MKKLIPLVILLAACSEEECSQFDIRPGGKINGVETYVLRTQVLPNDQPISARDNAIIQYEKTCLRGYQDINVEYEKAPSVGHAYKKITFYCV